MDAEQGEKPPTKKKGRGMTRKSMIIKNRARGVKLVIKYNPDGVYVGQTSVHLTSYLGVLAHTMVPIRHNTWRDVPKELKNKLWDSIEATFTLDAKSRRNCMLTMGKCFRSFKNTLTVKFILPFKDQPEVLKKPPIQYSFIEDEDWTVFVKGRLSSTFQEFREAQKERRAKHVYNHHLSRKGYANLEDEMMATTGYTEVLDRSMLWKKAMQRKDGTYDEVVIPVVEKIDKLWKESQECGRSFSGNNDILTEALGTPENSGRVRAKGRHYTPRQYFNSVANHAMREFVKESQERQSKFEENILAKQSEMMPTTPQSDVGSSNIKQKQIVIPEVVEQPKHQFDDQLPTMEKAIEKKIRKCQLAIGTKENIVAGGTIILECGVNFLVIVDAPYEPNTPLPIPIPGQITNVGDAIGYQVLWPAQLVIVTTHPMQDLKKLKKQKTKELEIKAKSKNPTDIKNFATLVGLLLKEGKVHAVDIMKDVFGQCFRAFLMNEDMNTIISSTETSAYCIIFYIWHLHKKMVDAKIRERFVFVNPALVSKAGMGETSKENRSRVIANQLINANRADFIFIPYNPSYHWVLVALDTRTMTAYYLDSLQNQPYDDLREIVNMALRIHPPQKQKSSKREPSWVVV